ncbi:MAG: hypothetical protein Q3994_01035, partial [Prevotella sp.]|nr:hypothetical protein [Prevotella sp.]
FIVDLEVSYQFLFLVLAESFWVSQFFYFFLSGLCSSAFEVLNHQYDDLCGNGMCVENLFA